MIYEWFYDFSRQLNVRLDREVAAVKQFCATVLGDVVHLFSFFPSMWNSWKAVISLPQYSLKSFTI